MPTNMIKNGHKYVTNIGDNIIIVTKGVNLRHVFVDIFVIKIMKNCRNVRFGNKLATWPFFLYLYKMYFSHKKTTELFENLL